MNACRLALVINDVVVATELRTKEYKHAADFVLPDVKWLCYPVDHLAITCQPSFNHHHYLAHQCGAAQTLAVRMFVFEVTTVAA